MNDAYKLVQQQAEDDGLWFQAQTASEAYLQQELRRLHAVIELSTTPAPDIGRDVDGMTCCERGRIGDGHTCYAEALDKQRLPGIGATGNVELIKLVREIGCDPQYRMGSIPNSELYDMGESLLKATDCRALASLPPVNDGEGALRGDCIRSGGSIMIDDSLTNFTE